MWAFWVIMEILLAIVGAAFVATQILWPALTRKPLFPSFRKRVRELNEVEADLYDAELALKIQEKRRELDELQRRAAAGKSGQAILDKKSDS